MGERKPFAVANWKMAMTIEEGRQYVREFAHRLGEVARAVDVVLCPPCTALYPVGQLLKDSPIQLGAQNLSSSVGAAHTGEVSADLLVDVGCQWVLVGHWEIRRRDAETDSDVNEKLRTAHEAGLRPVLLVGEDAEERGAAREALDRRLPALFQGLDAHDVARMAVVYEPEWTIGVDEPAPVGHIAAGCAAIRDWVAESYDLPTGDAVRIIYGGSVTPQNAAALMAPAEVDGLGAGRQGRDPKAFAAIVRTLAKM